MGCKPTGIIKFSQKSLTGLNNVRDIVKRGEMAEKFFFAGIFSTLFSTNALVMSQNITMTDWHLLAQASRNLPEAFRHQIRIQAGVLATDYSLPRKERDFWTCVLTDK